MTLGLLNDAITIPSGSVPDDVGFTIGKADADLHVDPDEGIEGLDMVDTTYASVPAQRAGTWGGAGMISARQVSIAAFLAAEYTDGAFDFGPLWDLRAAMVARPNPNDELPLCFAGLTWPGEHALWCRPTRFRSIVGDDDSHDGVPGVDLGFEASDPVVYSAETSDRSWATGSPVTTDEWAVGNDGFTLPFAARRTWLLRMTAHGTLTNPWVRVDHADGSWEKITFTGSLTGGQVLTLGPDLLPRVGSQIVSAWVSSTSDVHPSPSPSPYWWRLHAGTVEDEVNVVSVGRSSGSFSGYLKVRSGWL